MEFLGKYRIIETLGKGRFSTVYLSEHPFLKKNVAIKLMDPEQFTTTDIIQNFIREVRSVANFKNDNILQIIDLVENQKQLFIVLEYMAGRDLNSWQITHGRLTISQITNVISEIASALDLAHKSGFIHGDVKPGNILISDNFNAKLADLGVIKAIELSGALSNNVSLSTPAYISPEQANGDKATPFSDQYSLGVIAYELLTGKLPFTGDTAVSIYMQHVRDTPVVPSRINPLISQQIDSVINQVLSKDPGKRFADCSSFARALTSAGTASNDGQFKTILDRIEQLLEENDLHSANSLLEFAAQLNQQEKSEIERFKKLKSRVSAINSYQNSSDAIDNVRGNAEEFLNIITPIADPHGVFAGLNPNPTPLAIQKLISLRYGIASFLIMLLISIFIGLAGISYDKLAPADSKIKTTLVAIARSQTPVPPTSTQTLTPAPTFTQTLEPTWTPTIPPTNTPVPTIGVGSQFIRGLDGMIMVYVPDGQFTMGSDNNIDEKPVHQVNTNAYWIDQTEVTNGMYILCVNSGNCSEHTRNASFSRAKYYGENEFSNYPVLQITWNQAASYCKWIGGRLPSEAEWEKASRGTDERQYPWGNQIDSTFANYGRFVGDTTSSGFYLTGASIYGVLDLVGNASEWVNSLYKRYPFDANDGREDPNAAGARVIRGGSWSDNQDIVKSYARAKLLPVNQGDHIGFRCVIDNPNK